MAVGSHHDCKTVIFKQISWAVVQKIGRREVGLSTGRWEKEVIRTTVVRIKKRGRI